LSQHNFILNNHTENKNMCQAHFYFLW